MRSSIRMIVMAASVANCRDLILDMAGSIIPAAERVKKERNYDGGYEGVSDVV